MNAAQCTDMLAEELSRQLDLILYQEAYKRATMLWPSRCFDQRHDIAEAVVVKLLSRVDILSAKMPVSPDKQQLEIE